LNPADPPIIEPNYCTHLFDKRVIIEGTRAVIRYLDAPSLRRHTKEQLVSSRSETENDILVRGLSLYLNQHISSPSSSPPSAHATKISLRIQSATVPSMNPNSRFELTQENTIQDLLATAGAPGLHAAGTVKMGRPDDVMACVDSGEISKVWKWIVWI
jgi:choline dehydrogenase-like flavoprotein